MRPVESRGEHELKGVPDRWRLYRVVGGEAGSFSSAEVRRPFSQQPLHKAPRRRI